MKEQGNYVITVEGIDWFDYQGFMIPAYLPHCIPEISMDVAKEVLRISGRPFVRYDREFGREERGEWWYVLKRGPWAIEHLKDKKKRWMIRQGRKLYTVRPLTSDEVVSECPMVALLAAERYKGKVEVESQQVLKARVSAANKLQGVLEYIGCFHNDMLVSYSENYIQDNAVWLANIRHVPAFLKKYSSYGLLDGILEYYLNTKKMDYVLDGSRSIHHRTNIQEHLMRVFSFSKEYANLNVEYSAKFKVMIKIAYPFRNIAWAIRDKWATNLLDNVGAVLKQEEIRKSYGKYSTVTLKSRTAEDVEIVKLLPEHAREVAGLHISGIPTGVISSYGIDFVTSLYEAIATSKYGFGFVALMGNRVLGFSSFTTDVSALYKSVIFRNGVKFALALSKKIFSWGTAKAVFETLFYPKRVKKMKLPSAEFLSMVVAEEARGKGLATNLMRRGFQECAKNGIEKIKILAAVHIKPINKLYEKNGFDLVAQIKNHGILSNIYVTYTDDKKRAEAKLKGSEFKQ